MTTASTTFVSYYEILGVPPTADADVIEQKIKEELRIWRKRQGSPDLSKRQEAEVRMQHLTAAREVLSDPGKRTAYDHKLATHRASAPRPSGAPGGRNWVVLAEEYLAQNDYHSAAYAAREATQMEGNSARAWNLRARANAGLGQLSDAAYEARQAAELPVPALDRRGVPPERRAAAGDADPGADAQCPPERGDGQLLPRERPA